MGVTEQLTASRAVNWSSNNPNVTVDSNGNLNASADALAPGGQAVITASDGLNIARCNVTIVPWTANVLTLESVDVTLNLWPSLFTDGTTIYGVNANALYRSLDGLMSATRLPDLPATASHAPLLFTPNGTFFRAIDGIYKSTDGMQTWTLCVGNMITCLVEAFDFYYDSGTGNVYVYAGEYDTITTNRHKVYRGVIASNGDETWTVIKDFRSPVEYDADPGNPALAARHIHVVKVDQSTGDLYVDTGDAEGMTWFLRSTDQGDTWQTLGANDGFRMLSVWFTDDYMYWNIDSTNNQAIWRLARTDIPSQAVGNDLKSKVADLVNSSFWYTCSALDDNDVPIQIVSQSNEGAHRDMCARLFSIKENQNGTVSIEEIHMIYGAETQTQLEPKFQVGDYLYCVGRNTDKFMWKMIWKRLTPPATS